MSLTLMVSAIPGSDEIVIVVRFHETPATRSGGGSLFGFYT